MTWKPNGTAISLPLESEAVVRVVIFWKSWTALTRPAMRRKAVCHNNPITIRTVSTPYYRRRFSNRGPYSPSRIMI